MSGENTSLQGVEGGPSSVLRGVSVGSTEELLQLQRENAELYFACVDAVRHDTQRKIIHALVHGHGATDYTEIREIATVTDRTLRKHVTNLQDKNLVERVNSRVSRIQFTSVEVRALAAHALNCYY